MAQKDEALVKNAAAEGLRPSEPASEDLNTYQSRPQKTDTLTAGVSTDTPPKTLLNDDVTDALTEREILRLRHQVTEEPQCIAFDSGIFPSLKCVAQELSMRLKIRFRSVYLSLRHSQQCDLFEYFISIMIS